MTDNFTSSFPASPVAGNDTANEIGNLRVQLAETRQQLRRGDPLGVGSEREALLRGELQRRVRNTQALVRSVFARTIETGVSVEEVGLHFSGRLDVLARYELLPLVGQGGGVDLEGLVRDEFHDFNFGYGAAIVIEGPDVVLDFDHAQPFALAVHELVTNALKFGALATAGGSMSVTWTVADEGVAFIWQETGVSVVASAPLHRGFGREFIEDALPYQIGAETLLELRPGGVFCRIFLPIGSDLTSIDDNVGDEGDQPLRRSQA